MKNTIYKAIFLFLTAVLPLISGCKAGKNAGRLETYVSQASPDTSAMIRQIYKDGKTTTDYLFSVEDEKEILSALSSVKTYSLADWTPSETTEPIIGLSVGSKGGEISLLFFPDVVVTDSGEVFEYKFDVEKLLQKYNWEDSFSVEGIGLPNQYYCALGTAGWNTAYLNTAKEPSSCEGILSLNDISLDGNKVTGSLELKADGSWFYGKYYYLQVNLADSWYSLPARQLMIFEDIGLVLSPGSKTSLEYSLTAWGDLPAGKYRIAVPGNYIPSYEESIPCDAVLEFEIK